MAHKESIKEKKARLQREKDGSVVVTAQPSLETLESSASDTEASDSPSEGEDEESGEGEVSDNAGDDSSDLDVSDESEDDEDDDNASADGTSDSEDMSSAAASEGKSNSSSAASQSGKGKPRKSNSAVSTSRSSKHSKDEEEAEFPPVGGKPKSGRTNGGVVGLFNTRVVDQPAKEVELVVPKTPSSPTPSSVGNQRSKAAAAKAPASNERSKSGASRKEIRSSVHATVDQKQLLTIKTPFFEGYETDSYHPLKLIMNIIFYS